MNISDPLALMNISDSLALQNFLEKVKPSLPTVTLNLETEKKGAHEGARLRTSSEYVAAAASEQKFLLGQFLRAKKEDTDHLGYTETMADVVSGYEKLGLAEGKAGCRLLFERQVKAPSNAALKELFGIAR